MATRDACPAKCEVRSVIRFLNLQGQPAVRIHEELVSVYGTGVMSVEKVRKWCREFKAGRTDVHDLSRSGRPNTAVNVDSITAVRALVQNNHRITEEEIRRSLADENCIEVSHGTVHTIVHDILEYRKVCARWVPKCLTTEHKQNHMGAALTFLTWYHNEGEEFLSCIVTGDEAWVHYFRPESKQQSMSWIEKGGKAPTKFKQVDLAGKVLLTLFWDSRGVLLEEYLPPGWTINAEVYCETLFKLCRAIQNKRSGKLSKGIVFLHDNARPHTARLTQLFLTDFKWDVFPHPAHSPDLAPSDFHAFPFLQRHLGGKRHATDQDVKNSVHAFLSQQAASFYSEGIAKLISRYEKCLERFGDYVEK